MVNKTRVGISLLLVPILISAADSVTISGIRYRISDSSGVAKIIASSGCQSGVLPGNSQYGTGAAIASLRHSENRPVYWYEWTSGHSGGAHQFSINADCRSYKSESTADVEGKVFSESLRYDEGTYCRTIGKAKTCGKVLSADSRAPEKSKGAFVPVYGGKNARGPEDLEAEISLTWTSERLSVDIKVQDEAVKFGEGLAFDHIEWWFSKAGLTATDRKASPENSVQALIYCGQNGEVASMYGFPERKDAFSEITGKCQARPGGYFFRFSIPGHLVARPRLVSSSAPQAALEEGDVFLMTFLVSDSDSGSKQESILATSQFKWGMPATFGRLVLVKEGRLPLASQNLLME